MTLNESTHPETIQKSSRERIVSLSVLATSIVVLVLIAIFAPDAQFNFIFGTTPWLVICAIAVVVSIYWAASTFDESRKSKIYLTSDGSLDVSTPRCYTPLKVNFISKILGRANIFGQKNLDEFRFADGRIYIRNSKGDEVEGALKDLEFSYKTDKNKLTDEWEVYQYRISDGSGNKVQFNKHSSLFTDEEYADIDMILSLCGTIKESKISKLTKSLDKVIGGIQDFDFSNITGEITNKAVDIASEKSMSAVGKLARQRLADKAAKVSKKSWFKKALKITLGILLGLYILAVIIVNVEPLFNRSHDAEVADSTEDVIDSNEIGQEDNAMSENWEAFNEMAADDIYECVFEDNNKTFYITLTGETGGGAYLAPSGNLYELSIDDENDTRTMFICSATDADGQPSKIKFYIEFSEYGDSVEGWMIGTDGETQFSFVGSKLIQ